MVKYETENMSLAISNPGLEAFRILSTNLALNRGTGALSVVSINSFRPGDGRTTIAINLCIASAKSGLKTLFVDGDIRKPGNLKKHGENIAGLTNYRANNDLKDFIMDTDINSLKCIWAGTRVVDPIEFLNSPDYSKFVEDAARDFDLVVIDTPPNGQYVDGSIIASKASGCLLVVRAHKTTEQNVKLLKWQMQNVEAKIIGIVMNRIPDSEYKRYFFTQ